LEAPENDVEAAGEVRRLAEGGEVVVQELDHRAGLVDREPRLALAAHAAAEQHDRPRMIVGLRDPLRLAEVRLPVGEVSGIDGVEATSSVEEDALERELVLGAEVLHLRGEIYAHAVVASRRIPGREPDLRPA